MVKPPRQHSQVPRQHFQVPDRASQAANACCAPVGQSHGGEFEALAAAEEALAE